MYEDKIQEAIAQLLGVDSQVIEIIEPYIGEDLGSSNEGVHYSYYAEFPVFESLEVGIQEYVLELLEGDVSKIPFGSIEYYGDSELSNTLADPFGVRADFEEAEYYEKFVVPKESVLTELEEIENKLQNEDDEMITKALVLSAFSITEGYLKSFVWLLIPDIEASDLDSKLKEVLLKHLRYKLSEVKGRKEIFKIFSDEKRKLPDIPDADKIRNPLAHDMSSCSVDSDKIITKQKDGNDLAFNIQQVIQNLKNYVQNL